MSTIEFNGETHSFKNLKFVHYLGDKPELREYLRLKVKEVLYIESDPHRRTDTIVLEELSKDEDV